MQSALLTVASTGHKLPSSDTSLRCSLTREGTALPSISLWPEAKKPKPQGKRPGSNFKI